MENPFEFEVHDDGADQRAMVRPGVEISDEMAVILSISSITRNLKVEAKWCHQPFGEQMIRVYKGV